MKLLIHAKRQGYSPQQIERTLTIGELREVLEEYDEDIKVYLSHDNGYTYGGIAYDDFDEMDDEQS